MYMYVATYGIILDLFFIFKQRIGGLQTVIFTDVIRCVGGLILLLRES